MKIHSKIVLAALVCASSPYAVAQNTCLAPATAIYYGNGVGRGIETLDDAIDSSQKLQRLLKDVVTENEFNEYEFKLAFNQSGGRLADIFESARQVFGNEWPSILVALILGDSRILSLLPAELVQDFNDFLNSESIRKLVTPDLANADLTAQLASYTSDIEEGKKIVLVSHSQGNIFGNLVYPRLPADKQQYFTMVPVASPESTSRRSIVNEHVRFRDDLVILGVEAARRAAGLPVPLVANDDDDVDADWTGHGFVEAYLADPSSRAFIVQATSDSSRLLSIPPATSMQGAITATLTWGANPDVDLHSFEPNGGHIYYRNLRGLGELDVDDTNGFGPEHYVVSCERLRTTPAAIGRYRIGVNYYFGSTAETARVTIKTPDQESTFSTLLQTPRSSAGNNSPVPVADVLVTKDPSTGRFEFLIEPK